MSGSGVNQTVVIEENEYEKEIKEWRKRFETLDVYTDQFLTYARLLIEGSGNGGYCNYFGDHLHPIIINLYENMEELIKGRLMELYTETEMVVNKYLAEIEQRDQYFKSSAFSTNSRMQ